MIRRKLRRPKKEPKVGITLRLDETEFDFLHEVKNKRGCSMSGYIRFLIHRATYENSKIQSKRYEKVMESVNLLLHENKLTKTYRFLATKSEREELERIKLERGISYNSYIRW